MAILKNCEIWWVKLDPKRPDIKTDSKKPAWGFQMRTKDKAQRKEWIDHHITVKAVRQDEDDEESPILYWRANLRKRIVNSKGEPSKPVEVRSGYGDLDPNTIGNGSIVNVRIFEYEYVFEGKPGMAAMPMAIQMVKHIVYTPEMGEDFEDDIKEDREDAPPREHKIADKSQTSAADVPDDDDLDGKY